MYFLNKKSLIVLLLLLLVVSSIVYYFDKALFLGFLLTTFLSAITFFILDKLSLVNKQSVILFLIALGVHMAVAMVIYYAHFQPFGEGDFVWYQQIAEELSQRIHQGKYTLQGINIPHYYPVLISVLYAITLPKMIIGQMVSAWFAALSVVMVYFLVQEIGGLKRSAFWVALAATFYPSYLYFGSLLLKDTVVAPLVFIGLLLAVKLIKHFTWTKFLIFFLVLTGLIHLRFYVGFALMFSFIVSWFLISSFTIKKRMGYGLIIIFLLGFSPQFLGYGYYGATPLRGYLNKKTIVTYREVVYAPVPPPVAPVAVVSQPITKNDVGCNNCPPVTSTPTNDNTPKSEDSGRGSSFVVGAGFDNPFTFVFNYLLSFIYSLLGPFPWQIKHMRQALALLETIPWYIVICGALYSIVRSSKKEGFMKTIRQYRLAVPLFLFGIMALGALSLFINNFGIITRIRIPALIVLLSAMSLSWNSSSIFQKIYEKKSIIFYYLPFLQTRAGSQDI